MRSDVRRLPERVVLVAPCPQSSRRSGRQAKTSIFLAPTRCGVEPLADTMVTSAARFAARKRLRQRLKNLLGHLS